LLPTGKTRQGGKRSTAHESLEKFLPVHWVLMRRTGSCDALTACCGGGGTTAASVTLDHDEDCLAVPSLAEKAYTRPFTGVPVISSMELAIFTGRPIGLM
jgi:hypothetical protein